MKNILVITSLFFLGCQRQCSEKHKNVFFRMDTVTEITIVEKRPSKAGGDKIAGVWDSVDSLLKDWEERFSETHPLSEVKKVNCRTGNAVAVSPILGEMLFVGLEYCSILNGMFDLTILPIKELWGFGEREKKQELPSPEMIKSALQNVSCQNVSVDTAADSVYLTNPGSAIDVGGIAKGFVLREIGRLLDKMGYKDYLVVAGGDIISRGSRIDGGAWKIGIQHPRDPQKKIAVLELDSGSIVTSGDYERYYIIDGKRYHHIFNPKTGYSCSKNQSLTIWCMDPVRADVLSTGLFCLSKDSISAFVEERPLLECVVVDSSGEIFVSGGWKNSVKLTE